MKDIDYTWYYSQMLSEDISHKVSVICDLWEHEKHLLEIDRLDILIDRFNRYAKLLPDC